MDQNIYQSTDKSAIIIKQFAQAGYQINPNALSIILDNVEQYNPFQINRILNSLDDSVLVVEFDAHHALAEKYDAVKETYGEQAYLDVLTCVRLAKKILKEAECYKKGNHGQGGLGGIGVEYWILQNDGDIKKAFTSFAESAFDGDVMVSFEEFKKRYKIYSAGQNIRGGVVAENWQPVMSKLKLFKISSVRSRLRRHAASKWAPPMPCPPSPMVTTTFNSGRAIFKPAA